MGANSKPASEANSSALSVQYFLSLENYTLYHLLSLLLHLGHLNVLSMALDVIIEAPLQEFFDSIFCLLCAI